MYRPVIIAYTDANNIKTQTANLLFIASSSVLRKHMWRQRDHGQMNSLVEQFFVAKNQGLRDENCTGRDGVVHELRTAFLLCESHKCRAFLNATFVHHLGPFTRRSTGGRFPSVGRRILQCTSIVHMGSVEKTVQRLIWCRPDAHSCDT